MNAAHFPGASAPCVKCDFFADRPRGIGQRTTIQVFRVYHGREAERIGTHLFAGVGGSASEFLLFRWAL
jgi:hypothetical protein